MENPAPTTLQYPQHALVRPTTLCETTKKYAKPSTPKHAQARPSTSKHAQARPSICLRQALEATKNVLHFPESYDEWKDLTALYCYNNLIRQRVFDGQKCTPNLKQCNFPPIRLVQHLFQVVFFFAKSREFAHSSRGIFQNKGGGAVVDHSPALFTGFCKNYFLMPIALCL